MDSPSNELALAPTIIALIKTGFVARFRVSGRSMEPALVEGEMLWGVRIRPRRGSIVIFPHPHRPDFWLTKRVVAVPGDTVEIDFGSVLINGQVEIWGSGETFPEGGWEVGDGSVFVLSDNRPATADDSRTFGPVQVSSMYRAIRRSRSRH